MPPPIRSSASYTTTSSPARASVIAAARPFGPEPMTAALRAKDLPHARNGETVCPLRGRLAVVRRVRRDDQVGRQRREQRLLPDEHVERRTAEAPGTKRRDHGALVHHRTARRV